MTEERPSFMRFLSKAVVFGFGVGLFFYMLGGMAAPYFTGINALFAGAFGFFIGAGAALERAFD